MIQLGTFLKVTDKTGVVLAQCIKVFGYSKKRIAYIGDVILISVKWLNIKRFKLFKLRWQKRFSLGTMHRGLVIRSKMNYCRTSGVFIRFNENAIVLVNKRVVPVSNRVYGPVLKELCMKWPSLGCVSRLVI